MESVSTLECELINKLTQLTTDGVLLWEESNVDDDNRITYTTKIDSDTIIVDNTFIYEDDEWILYLNDEPIVLNPDDTKLIDSIEQQRENTYTTHIHQVIGSLKKMDNTGDKND